MYVDVITPFIPKTGFFRLYHELTRWGEVCPRYNFFVACTVLGSVLKRRIYLQRGSKTTFPTLYPNPWIMLIGPQGRGKKSTALRTGKEILSLLPEHLKPKIIASKITPEALIKALASHEVAPHMYKGLPKTPARNVLRKQAIALVSSSELGVFLGKEKYNAGLVSLLTEIYDCQDEWQSDTVMRGDQWLYDIALTINAASTPTWMQTSLPVDAFKTGFMSRWWLVPLPYNWRKRVTDPPCPPEGLESRIIEELEKMAELQGRMEFSVQAFELFDSWYMSIDSSLMPEALAAYLERRQDHLLRFAMLLQIAETPNKLILSPEVVQRAIDILKALEPDINDLIEFIAVEPRMRSVQTTLEVVRRYGSISEPQLIKKVWRSLGRPDEWMAAVILLVKAKEIEGPFFVKGVATYSTKNHNKGGKK